MGAGNNFLRVCRVKCVMFLPVPRLSQSAGGKSGLGKGQQPAQYSIPRVGRQQTARSREARGIRLQRK